MKEITIAFPAIYSKDWMGGYNYLLNLLSALSLYQKSEVNPVLFCGTDFTPQELEPFYKIEGIKIVIDTAFNKNQRTAHLIKSLLFGRSNKLQALLDKNKIDVIFESANFYGWRINQKALAWLPDFQHRHMPHLFSKLSWWKRDIGFKAQIVTQRHILLSSESALADFNRFYKAKKNHLHVLRFPPLINQNMHTETILDIKEKYNISEKFFYISNQFWQHKNHLAVINALDILKKSSINTTVVCTGSTQDPRSPNHFTMLEQKISDLGLTENFKILGLIPRQHTNILLRSCLAIINPSFFEGWNSSVEEAKFFNVPMLLSNISVHYEQAGESGYYFDPNKPNEIVELMINLLSDAAPTSLREPALSDINTNSLFAEKFTHVISNIIN